MSGFGLRRLHEEALRPSSRIVSWRAGEPRARRRRVSCSMRWSRHYTIDGRSITAGSCTIATGHPVRITSSAWLKLASSLRSAATEIPMTTLSPKPERSLQGRGDTSARLMAQLRGRRVCDPGMGGLVQQPTAHLPSLRPKPSGATTLEDLPWWLNLNQMASGNLGRFSLLRASPFSYSYKFGLGVAPRSLKYLP